MAPIAGTCREKFEGVRAVFESNLESGADIGASVAVFVDGEPVVDLWGGYADGTFTRPFGPHTIAQCFSSTKTMTALCALILADRGEIDLHAPVAKYWPEFAAAGKGAIEVRQLLGHTSGLCGWAELMTLEDICDWDKSTGVLARQAPFWEPGRVSGYHGMNQGHLVGEIVRRVTGKTLGRFLAEEVAGPLGVAPDIHIGTPEEYDANVSLLIQGAPHDPAQRQLYFDRSLMNPRVKPQDTWSVEWRRAELGALNGHANARGIAAIQSVLASGGANGARLMSEAGRERVMEQQSDGVDLVMGLPCRWGMGYSLDHEYMGVPANTRVAWWGGNGGSLSFVDLDARFSVGFVPNRWGGGGSSGMERARGVLRAVYAALG